MLLQDYVNKQKAKPCEKDKEGFSYLKLNSVIKTFCISAMTISVLVFAFIPSYLEESHKLAYTIIGFAVVSLILSLKIFLMSYKLTNKGLVYGSIIKKTVLFSELINAAKKNPPYIDSQQNAILAVNDKRMIRLPMSLYCGSENFVFELEAHLHLLIDSGKAKSIKQSNTIRGVLVIIIMLLMFFLIK